MRRKLLSRAYPASILATLLEIGLVAMRMGWTKICGDQVLSVLDFFDSRMVGRWGLGEIVLFCRCIRLRFGNMYM